ncbi:MAG: coproporphyrinogen dehydrogenase HemZ [Clostridiales bacterium]|nr:coproporphyrinogen dehydrogenase HemZ [Clostridiales bacterium]
MIKVILKGHDKYYGIADVVRLFFPSPVEDKENGIVYCKSAPDILIENELLPTGLAVSRTDSKEYFYDGTPEEAGREVKRSLYMALADITGMRPPWGCLTGIRPTLVALETGSAGALADRFLVRPDKARHAMKTGQAELKILERIDPDDINIYIGVPFCPSRCEYCSFVSSDISHHMGRLKDYKEHLIEEIGLIAPKIRRRIGTLYMGGGTPTVFDDGDFTDLIEAIYGELSIDDDCEVTIEAGRPDTITTAKLKAMADHGIKRICINPQTMNDTTLARLNRRHTAQDTVRAIEEARSFGFDVINSDIIAGLKYETADDFIDTAGKLIDLDLANITVHTLYKKRRASMSLEDVMANDEAGDVDKAVTTVYEMLEEAGYKPYYMYKQKDTGHGLENTGFEKGNTPCLYNVAMMTDARDVLSFGAGGMSKRVFDQLGTAKYRVERCSSSKDVLDYMMRTEEIARKKADFFGL